MSKLCQSEMNFNGQRCMWRDPALRLLNMIAWPFLAANSALQVYAGHRISTLLSRVKMRRPDVIIDGLNCMQSAVFLKSLQMVAQKILATY